MQKDLFEKKNNNPKHQHSYTFDVNDKKVQILTKSIINLTHAVDKLKGEEYHL